MLYLLYAFAFIEVIAHVVALAEVYKLIEKKFVKFIDRCIVDVRYRNDFISHVYFFKDMGPNIASVSIVSMIVADEAVQGFALLALFIVGIMAKHISRKLIKAFYSVLKKKGDATYVYKLDNGTWGNSCGRDSI